MAISAPPIDERSLSLLEAVPTPLVISEPDGRVILVNQAFTDLTGYRIEDIPTVTAWMERAYPANDYRAVVENEWRSLIASTGPRGHLPERLTTITTADGHRRSVRFSVRMVDGLCLIGAADVSAAIEAEHLLVASEERFHSVLHAAPLGVHLYELREGRLFLIDANPASDRFTGADVQGRIGLDIEHAFPGLAGSGIPERYRAVAENGQPWHQSRMDYHDASIHGSFEVHAFRYGANRVAVFFTDITERIRLEERLHQGEKLEAVGRLAGGVAHDFNNHLTAILGHAELLAASLPSGGREAGFAGTIVQAAERAAALVRQLLAFSRKDQLTPTTISINSMIEETVGILGRSLDPRIRVATLLAPNLPRIKGDASRLSSALINLAVNARDAMPGGGELTFQTTAVRLDAAQAALLVGNPAPGRFVRISVRDTGGGLSEEVTRHLFEPFFTTKAKGKGTGLGLATVFASITAHRGGIAVSGQPGVGADFILYLPIPNEDPSSAEVRTASPVRLAARILVCDDEPAVRAILGDALRTFGCEVEVVTDGKSAIQRWNERPGAFDLLILDMMMPGMHGASVFNQLRQQDPNARVLFVSGHGGDSEHEAVLAHGAAGFLAKPFSVAKLGAAVRKALAG